MKNPEPVRVPVWLGEAERQDGPLRFRQTGYDIDNLSVDLIGESGQVWATYSNQIYGLLPGHNAHLQLVDRRPDVNVTVGLPYNLLVHIEKP
jgi:hypothetical protein